MAERLKRKITSTFKFNGLSIRSDVCSLLVSQLLPIDESEHDEWLDKIIESIQKQSINSPLIEKEHVERALQECIRIGADETNTVFNVINAFEVPLFTYNPERKKFLKDERTVPQLFDGAAAKAQLFKKRYTILLQCTKRHKLFTPAILGSSSEEKKYTLMTVEYLLSSTGKVSGAIVLGMITQLKEGCYHLEDPTGVVQLDLSEAKYHTGLFTENCFIVAEGTFEDKILHVAGMGFPAAEPSATSRAYFGNVNTFGGPSETNVRSSAELLRYEKDNDDAVLVFIADVWLDSIKVMEKLQVLFAGFADIAPVAFIFMGNFLSSQQGSKHSAMLKQKFKGLADLIVQFPELVEKSKFVFIPGSSDPSSPNILPRFPLPKYITEEFQRRIPTAVFTTNPCRIQYCTQEIVVVREDLMTKMCRNTIYFPTAGDIPNHFAKTIINQAHLAPLPISVCPVYWSFDTALQLYPVPDLVVVADQGNSFTATHMDCQIINPGSFPKNDFSFKTYIPSERRVEDSQIPTD